LQNGVSLTRPLVNTAHGNGWASSQALRFNCCQPTPASRWAPISPARTTSGCRR
jgi:hypothetical protein